MWPIHEVAEVKLYLYEVLSLASLADTDAGPSNEATTNGGTSDGSESDVESNSIYENVTSTSINGRMHVNRRRYSDAG